MVILSQFRLEEFLSTLRGQELRSVLKMRLRVVQTNSSHFIFEINVGKSRKESDSSIEWRYLSLILSRSRNSLSKFRMSFYVGSDLFRHWFGKMQWIWSGLPLNVSFVWHSISLQIKLCMQNYQSKSLCVIIQIIYIQIIYIYFNGAFTELTLDLNRQFRNKRSNIIHSLWIINLYLFWLIQHRSFNIWNSSILITSNENRLKWGLQKSCDENLIMISDCILFEPDMNLFVSHWSHTETKVQQSLLTKVSEKNPLTIIKFYCNIIVN